MKKLNGRGLGSVETALLLVLVALVCFVGGYVWHAKQAADKNLAVHPTSVAASKPGAPIFKKLPSDWIEYRSAANGLRLGYPMQWGTLDQTTLQTPSNQDQAGGMQGRLSITFSEKVGFTVVARKYGATIKPSDDGKTWVVADENPAVADNYKVGDVYKARKEKVSGGSAIDLSFVDEGCTQTRYLLTLKSSYAVITIPEFCPEEPANSNSDAATAAKTAYSQLLTDFLSSITVY